MAAHNISQLLFNAENVDSFIKSECRYICTLDKNYANYLRTFYAYSDAAKALKKDPQSHDLLLDYASTLATVFALTSNASKKCTDKDAVETFKIKFEYFYPVIEDALIAIEEENKLSL